VLSDNQIERIFCHAFESGLHGIEMASATLMEGMKLTEEQTNKVQDHYTNLLIVSALGQISFKLDPEMDITTTADSYQDVYVNKIRDFITACAQELVKEGKYRANASNN